MDCGQEMPVSPNSLVKNEREGSIFTKPSIQTQPGLKASRLKSIETQLSTTGIHKRDTENRKRTKFSRDTIDYETNQVYRWQDSTSSRRQPPRNHRSSTDYSTSGSEPERNPNSSTAASFLGPRRRFPKRRTNGANQRRDTTEQRITRSKCIKGLGRVPVDTILVTLDVKDLYTSIPHLDGINAVHHSLTTAGLTTSQINLCVELLTIVLYNNFFLFQDTFYLQKRGTAMGSNVAPPYANTYMTEFETSVIYKHPLFQNVSLWKRFIDDIFCIWGGTLESLQEFFLFLNGAWPGIKFTISHDSHSINFLDTMVLKDQAGFLTTDLFTKPTDRNSLLHFQSFHPPSTKRSIPITQFQRVKRIVPDRNLCENRLQNMTSKFIERGYPPRVLAQSRNPPPRHPTRDQGTRIPFVHSYHPFSFIIHKAIRRHWHLLSTAHPDIPEFRSPFLPCFRRPPNLRDGLVRADIGSADQRRQQFLSRPRNGTFLASIVHNATISGKTFRINRFFTCESSYVVYLIKCPCGLLYVGETTQSVRDRISKHKYTIRCQNLLLPIPHHFHSAGHSISQLRYQVIDSVPPPRRGGDRVALLHRKEAFWIHTLETLAPKGLNRDYELMAFVNKQLPYSTAARFISLKFLKRPPQIKGDGRENHPFLKNTNRLKDSRGIRQKTPREGIRLNILSSRKI
ncbi:unnamed protein product [Ranitomeya imitator]|uniref:GIY-YIG domain-containing protein n=1 Tax=Ranitomeya imitator TaxID=111125 RepID=A0ABN9MIK4_9NEOB|nr:unnamed protein product [Ranitomeya imitator]